MRLLVLLALALISAGATPGCSKTLGEGDPDIDSARKWTDFPLYWVGEKFEDFELEYVAVPPEGFATFSYGTCELGPFDDHGCAVPLQIQIQPLCAHLEFVAQAPIWKRREIRGAPVGTIDGAPVLFARNVQVKVYRGQGSDPGLPLRALRALHSVNAVAPVVGPDESIPAASRAVLAGEAPCTA